MGAEALCKAGKKTISSPAFGRPTFNIHEGLSQTRLCGTSEGSLTGPVVSGALDRMGRGAERALVSWLSGSAPVAGDLPDEA